MHPLIWFFLVCIFAPIVFYFSAKAAAFGWLSGRRLWEDRQQRKQVELFNQSTNQ